MSNQWLMPNKKAQGKLGRLPTASGAGGGGGGGRCQRRGAGGGAGGGAGCGAGRKITRGRDGEEERSPLRGAKVGLRRRRRQGALESLSLSDSLPTAGVNSTGAAALPTAGRSSSEDVLERESSSESEYEVTSTLVFWIHEYVSEYVYESGEPAGAPPTAGALVLLPEPATRALVLLLPEPALFCGLNGEIRQRLDLGCWLGRCVCHVVRHWQNAPCFSCLSWFVVIPLPF